MPSRSFLAVEPSRSLVAPRSLTYLVSCRDSAWLLAAVILGLSLIDGAATLRLLDAGFEEANPVIQAFLDRGPVAFLAGKLGLTVWGLGLILAFRRRPLCGGRLTCTSLLLALAAVYSAVIAYELSLAIVLML